MACMFPFSVKNPLYPLPNQQARIPVPCGRCPTCLRRRVSEWSFRLQYEERRHDAAYFVTLTYEAPPVSKNGFMTLRRTDMQKYFKRLRKLHPKGHSIKYYYCGEYGTKHHRPHYHAIIFGADMAHIQNAWSGHKDVCSETGLLDSVVLGHVDVGTVTGASIGYTLKYMNKGKVVPAHPRDDREPEYALMSKKLGDGYLLEKQNIRYHRADDTRQYLTNRDGFKVAMPRYYREKIWSKEERRSAGIKIAALHEQQEAARQSEYIKRTGSIDGYDKAVHEAKKASIQNFRRQANQKRKDV